MPNPQPSDALPRGGMPDIKPRSPVAALRRDRYAGLGSTYSIEAVSTAVGMSPTFVRKVLGRQARVSVDGVLALLDQDAFSETVVPRSRVIDWLEAGLARGDSTSVVPNPAGHELRLGHVLDLAHTVPERSVNCVVTSTPYWGTRIYEDSFVAEWADGETSAYGHEQTPDGFVRHTVEVLDALAPLVADDGSIWWNVMDTFNTRTQIRSSAAEALRAMQGRDDRAWSEHAARRYSAGHAYLKDGEQCLIPMMVAERASRIGLYVKSVITWAKTGSLPEPQESRVSRGIEHILHLTKQRTPKFSRRAYHECDHAIGGRNPDMESLKLSDIWILDTSAGRDGHGAQFPVSLPGRCIALSTAPGDLVLDPFVGSGNSGVAALRHGCAFLGWDVSRRYLTTAQKRIDAVSPAHSVG